MVIIYSILLFYVIMCYCTIDKIVLYYIIYHVVLCKVIYYRHSKNDVRVMECVTLHNYVDANPLQSELERVCESCLVPSLPSNRNENSLRNDVDAHPLPQRSGRAFPAERAGKSLRCLVPSLPSSRNVYSLPNDVDAHFLPDELERVC